MAISIAYTMDGVTVGATAVSIVSGTTTPQTVTDDGVYQLWVDTTNMAKGDEYEIVLKEKVHSGGTQRQFARWTLLGAQPENFVTPTFILMEGWDMLMKKLAGTDRAFDAEIRKVA